MKEFNVRLQFDQFFTAQVQNEDLSGKKQLAKITLNGVHSACYASISDIDRMIQALTKVREELKK